MANITQVKTTDGVIHDLEVDLSNYYTKSEVDASEALKADAADVYTKAQTDNLLGTKANASDVYDKLSIDTALGFKADKVDTYTKSETVNLVGSDITSLSTAQSTVDSTAASEFASLSAAQSEVNSLQTSELASLSTAESELGSQVTVIGSEVADKADATDVYTKTEADDKFIEDLGSVTITAVANTDTYGTALVKLFNAVDLTKLRSTSYMKITDYVYPLIATNNSSYCTFCITWIDGGSHIQVRMFTVDSNGSYRAGTDGTVTTATSNIVSAGSDTDFTIVY